MIHVIKPKNNAKVGVTVKVKGTATSIVQLYVLAKDDKWYLQPPVKMLKNIWSGTAYLGADNPVKNATYMIAAVLTADRPKTPLSELPANTLAIKVKVKIR